MNECRYDESLRILWTFGGIGINWQETNYREPGACLPQDGDAYEGDED